MIATTFIDSPVAPDGIVQLPLVPHTGTVNVSDELNGVLRDPTTNAARVSNNRHGVIGTNDDARSDPDAEAVNNPPPPASTPITVPIATQRDRPPTTRPNMTVPILRRAADPIAGRYTPQETVSYIHTTLSPHIAI